MEQTETIGKSIHSQISKLSTRLSKPQPTTRTWRAYEILLNLKKTNHLKKQNNDVSHLTLQVQNIAFAFRQASRHNTADRLEHLTEDFLAIDTTSRQSILNILLSLSNVKSISSTGFALQDVSHRAVQLVTSTTNSTCQHSIPAVAYGIDRWLIFFKNHPKK